MFAITQKLRYSSAAEFLLSLRSIITSRPRAEPAKKKASPVYISTESAIVPNGGRNREMAERINPDTRANTAQAARTFSFIIVIHS